MLINAVGVSDAHVVGYGTAAELPIGRLFEAIGRQQSCLQDAASGYRLQAIGERLKAKDYELLTSIISDTIPTFGSD